MVVIFYRQLHITDRFPSTTQPVDLINVNIGMWLLPLAKCVQEYIINTIRDRYYNYVYGTPYMIDYIHDECPFL